MLLKIKPDGAPASHHEVISYQIQNIQNGIKGILLTYPDKLTQTRIVEIPFTLYVLNDRGDTIDKERVE